MLVKDFYLFLFYLQALIPYDFKPLAQHRSGFDVDSIFFIHGPTPAIGSPRWRKVNKEAVFTLEIGKNEFGSNINGGEKQCLLALMKSVVFKLFSRCHGMHIGSI